MASRVAEVKCLTATPTFPATAIRYFGLSGGQRKKFAEDLPSAHVGSNCSSHGFVLILGDLSVES